MPKKFPEEFQRDVVAVARRGGVTRVGVSSGTGTGSTIFSVSIHRGFSIVPRKVVVAGIVAAAFIPGLVVAAMSPQSGVVNSGPFIEYDFAGDLTDNGSASTLTAVSACDSSLISARTPCNSSATFGTDSTGTYWQWYSESSRGGGFSLGTSSSLTTSHTIGLRFSFNETGSGYKKIIDYENRTNDNGLYFRNNRLLFFLGRDLPNTVNPTFAGGEVLDLIIVRDAAAATQSGMTAAFKVYSVTAAGTSLIIDVETDDSSKPYDSGTGSVLGFFFDDTATHSEVTTGGKIYALKVWDRAIDPSEITQALGPSLDPTATTTTTTAAPTTAAPTTAAPTTAAPTTAAPTTAAPTTAAPTTAAPTTAAPTTAAPTTTATTEPTPVLNDGALPELDPGESLVSEDGTAAGVELVVQRDDTELVLRGSDFEMTLAGVCSYSCKITTDTDGRQVLELEENGAARVEGEGFEVGSSVYAWLFSDPKYLGSLSVDADGNFSGTVDLGDVEVGNHTLQVNGTSADGKARSANLGVVVAPESGADAVELPATGSSSNSGVILAMLALGSFVLFATRRRTTN